MSNQLYNKNSEFIVVKDLIENPNNIEKYNLSKESFTSDVAVEIFSVIESINAQGLIVDADSVSNLLKNDVTRNFIRTYKTGSAAAELSYGMVKKFELLRKFEKAGYSNVVKKFYDPDIDFMKVDEQEARLIETSIDDIFDALQSEVKESYKLVDSIAALRAQYGNKGMSIKSLADLDEEIDAFQDAINRGISLPEFPLKLIPGSINLLVAATGTGKTTYLQSLILSSLVHSTDPSHTAAYISLEQERADIGRGLRNVVVEEKLSVSKKLFVEYVGGGTIENIKKKLVSILRNNYKYIVIDYLKPAIIDGPDTGYEKMGKLINTIQECLLEFAAESIVFVAVQGNSKSEGRSLDEIVATPSSFITEGSRTLETASTCLFIVKDETKTRKAVIVKSRYQDDMLDKRFEIAYSRNKLIKLIPEGTKLFNVGVQVSQSEVKKNKVQA